MKGAPGRGPVECQVHGAAYRDGDEQDREGEAKLLAVLVVHRPLRRMSDTVGT
jgi:hypothetical protein